MQQNRIWILGASDTEMKLIENLLWVYGESVIYATDATGRRVHQGNAYRCPIPEVPAGSTVYAVECIDTLPEGWVRIDHHRPGDPGYGQPPINFFSSKLDRASDRSAGTQWHHSENRGVACQQATQLRLPRNIRRTEHRGLRRCTLDSTCCRWQIRMGYRDRRPNICTSTAGDSPRSCSRSLPC